MEGRDVNLGTRDRTICCSKLKGGRYLGSGGMLRVLKNNYVAVSVTVSAAPVSHSTRRLSNVVNTWRIIIVWRILGHRMNPTLHVYLCDRCVLLEQIYYCTFTAIDTIPYTVPYRYASHWYCTQTVPILVSTWIFQPSDNIMIMEPPWWNQAFRRDWENELKKTNKKYWRVRQRP